MEMKQISQLKEFGYINIFGTFFITFFFFITSKIIKLDYNLYMLVFAYVGCIANGYFIIHHIEGKSGFDKSKLFDSLFLIPMVGAIAYIFWGLVFIVLDIFFNFSFYLIHILPINFL